MEFLSNAIVSETDHTLLGVLLTSFCPENYTQRSSVKFYTTNELKQKYSMLKPRGFYFDEHGTLRSDSIASQEASESAVKYVERECANLGKQTNDITDLVLFGVVNHGFVLPQGISEDPIMIAFSRFNVSASSFNIYAGYSMSSTEDSPGGYRTCSLLNSVDGTARDIVVAFPEGTVLPELYGTVDKQEDLVINGNVYNTYQVNVGLNCFPTCVGESFLNFLAYNVSFYNIGEKVIKQLKQNAQKDVPTHEKEERDSTPRARKTPVNVAIEHIYKESRLDDIMRNVGNNQAMRLFIQDYPDAAITLQWVEKVFSSPWYLNEGSNHDDMFKIYCACLNMLPQCRVDRLKYAIELLTHRYYIYRMGLANDFLGPILKGGGVDGESIKRFSFG